MKKSSFALVALMVVTMLGQFYFLSTQTERVVADSILKATQDANATVTKLFVNSVYPSVESVLKLNEPSSVDKLLTDTELSFVDDVVRRFVLQTDVLKVKIYSVSGLTKYSSDPSQIGDNKSDNSGFISARNGRPASQISHRGQFSAIEGEVFARDLVASYIPIFDASSSIVGVAELYTDRTPAIQQSKLGAEELQFVLIISLALLLLIAAGFFWLGMFENRKR